jgi:hypothetical protein
MQASTDINMNNRFNKNIDWPAYPDREPGKSLSLQHGQFTGISL